MVPGADNQLLGTLWLTSGVFNGQWSPSERHLLGRGQSGVFAISFIGQVD